MHGTVASNAMEALSEALSNRKESVSEHLRVAGS
jgi:hypothetical protein